MKLKPILLGLILALSAMSIISKPCFAYTVTVNLQSGISYQDEGTLEFDDTTKLSSLDNDWGPTADGTVQYTYYATGTDPRWFDAISAKFDLSGIGYKNIKTVTLDAFIKKGLYTDSTWHQYELYAGAFNSTNQDAPTGSEPLTLFHSFDFTGGDWIHHSIPLSWITSDNLDLSLRLWNAPVDQIKLTADVIPEPATLSLLGLGLLGLLGFRKKV